MAPNRRSSQVERRPFNARAQVADRVPDLPQDTGAAYAGIERAFNALENTLSADADRIAKEEGKQEGYADALGGGGKPRRDGTLRGAAYDDALVSTAIARLDVEYRRGALQLADQHENDPATLTRELNTFKEQLYSKPEYSGFLADPQIRANFNNGADRVGLALINRAGDKQSVKVKDDERAALLAQIDTIRRTADRLVAGAADDPARMQAALDELKKISRIRRTAVDKGLIKPDAAVIADQEDQDLFKQSSLLGQIVNMRSVDDVLAWQKGVEADYQAGKGIAGQLDARGFAEVMKRADAVARRLDVESRTVAATVTRELESVERRAAKGLTIKPEEIAAIENLAAGNPLALGAVRESRAAIEDLNNWRRMRPDELDLTVEGLRRKAQAQGSTEADYRRLERAQNLRDLVAKRITDNPLQWAAETGLATIEPVDPSSPESFKASMDKRFAQAEAVKQYYKLENVPVFTAAERARVAQGFARDGKAMLEFSQALNAAVGPQRAERIMKELAPNDPQAGFAGGLLQAGGSPRLASNAMEYSRLEREGAKLIRPLPNAFEDVYREAVGGALRMAPATEREVREIVQRAYAVEGRGKWDGKLDTPEQKKRMKELLDQAIGAITINGERYGGFQSVNDSATVVPASVRARSFNSIIKAIGDKDLDDQPFYDRSGKRKAATTLGMAKLIAVGAGQYEVYFGDPASGDAQPALTKSGEVYRLDWNRLEPKLRPRYSADTFRSVR